MPRLIGSAGERDVEPEFDDPVILTQNRLAYRDEPRVRDNIDEATDPLGMDLNIISLGSARQRSLLDALRLGEHTLDIFAQGIGPLDRKRALQADDPVTVQAAHDGRGVVRACHAGTLFRRVAAARLRPPLYPS